MRELNRFGGFVDSWNGQNLSGWVVDRSKPKEPCEIEILVRGESVCRTKADLLRADLQAVCPEDQRKGFDVRLPVVDGTAARIDVRIAGTSEMLPPANESVAAVLGTPRADLRVPHGGLHRWIPMPPAELISHVTGEIGDHDHLRRVFGTTGYSQAADIYNTILDLGADCHRPDYSIVDLGCGCGRIALFLSQRLEHATFLGVDIWRIGIEWASRHITSAYPKYRFHCPSSMEKGYEAGEHHAVPVADSSADLVVSHSLFTHLSTSAADGYLRETGRVLKPGGIALLTFFLQDDLASRAMEAMAGRVKRPLIRDERAWYYGSGGYLDICHDQERIVAVAKASKLRAVAVRHGWWRGPAWSSTNPIAFQDLLVLEREV